MSRRAHTCGRSPVALRVHTAFCMRMLRLVQLRDTYSCTSVGRFPDASMSDIRRGCSARCSRYNMRYFLRLCLASAVNDH